MTTMTRGAKRRIIAILGEMSNYISRCDALSIIDVLDDLLGGKIARSGIPELFLGQRTMQYHSASS